MFVQTEVTPNPNSLKFLPGKLVSNNGSFEITGGHPVLTSGGAWKSCNATDGQEMHPELNITELAVGDILVKDAGNANGDTVNEEITTIEVRTESEITVYNLDVTD